MMTETKNLIAVFDKLIAWENLPSEFKKTRDGWAAYKGGVRITRFRFTEQGAREDATDWEASDVKVQF